MPQHVRGEGGQLFAVVRLEDPLARGETALLEYDLTGMSREFALQLPEVGYFDRIRGGNAVALHEGLGELLAGFEPGGRRFGTDDRNPGRLQRIRRTGGQRNLGADYRVGNPVLQRRTRQGLRVGDIQIGQIFAQFGRAGVTRGDEETGYAFAQGYFPG